jgi:hypothetical protein
MDSVQHVIHIDNAASNVAPQAVTSVLAEHAVEDSLNFTVITVVNNMYQ